jgi:nitrate reductase gamma subunit
MSDVILFAVLPYIALISFVFVSIMRIRSGALRISSLSTQVLEGKMLFWGSNAWHYGLLIVLPGHLIAFLIPNAILAFNATPLRLFLLELTGLVGGLLMAFGLVILLFRRLYDAKVMRVSSVLDILILILFLLLVTTGLKIALSFRWGSSWYAAVMVPYLYSLLALSPDLNSITALPMEVKMHVLLAFLMFALLPFSKLIHVFSVPFSYPFRSPQLQRWNWDPKTIRDPEAKNLQCDDEPEEPEKWTFGL